MGNDNSWLFVVMIVGFIILNGNINNIDNSRCEYAVMTLAESLNRLPMYNEVISPTTVIDGIYNPNIDYYCVWIKDKSPEFINNTDKHELCHYLVKEDYDHFCGNIENND
jgi:hypothetical protein